MNYTTYVLITKELDNHRKDKKDREPGWGSIIFFLTVAAVAIFYVIPKMLIDFVLTAKLGLPPI
jgi:hypothetical protein